MSPRFSDEERTRIHDRLLEAGYDRFAAAGLKKTSVEEIATDAGIAKGSFYSFFGSKEELYLAVSARYAKQKSEHAASLAAKSQGAGVDSLRSFVRSAATAFADGSAYSVFSAADGEAAMRKLSPEVAMRYINVGEHWLAPAVRVWQQQGLAVDLDPQVVAELLGMVILTPLTPGVQHGDRFDRALDLLVDAVVGKLVGGAPHR